MYAQLNTEERSWNYRYSGIALSMTQNESAFVALGIQHTVGMRRSVICRLSASTIIFHIIS
jgi:hypothetical protein